MALIDTVTSMAEEVTERQRREDTNARRRALRRAARAIPESSEDNNENPPLLGAASREAATRDRARFRGRPQATPRFASGGGTLPAPPESERPRDVASYHDSRYAGNADDQGRPYYMPPPLGVGYDIGKILADMNQRFHENREQVHKQRAIQVAQFQAANRVRQEQSETGATSPPPVAESPSQPLPVGGSPIQGPTNSPINNVGGVPGQFGPYGGGTLPTPGMLEPGDDLAQVTRRQTPTPLLPGFQQER